MSKKKKIIIGVVSLVLILGLILTCVLVSLNNSDEDSRTQKEIEQAQKDNTTDENKETEESQPTDTDVLPVVPPDDTGDETTKDDIILDVTDKDRDPNPGVKDATIEYGTKEGAYDAE